VNLIGTVLSKRVYPGRVRITVRAMDDGPREFSLDVSKDESARYSKYQTVVVEFDDGKLGFKPMPSFNEMKKYIENYAELTRDSAGLGTPTGFSNPAQRPARPQSPLK
jgi:hypothetical protein